MQCTIFTLRVLLVDFCIELRKFAGDYLIINPAT